MEPGKPVKELSNRALLEESTEILRTVRDALAEFEPLLAMVRASRGNGGPSYVQAAGLRRTLRRKAPADAPRPPAPPPVLRGPVTGPVDE